jgi:uncharacterized protein YggT (Ycf19 family)
LATTQRVLAKLTEPVLRPLRSNRAAHALGRRFLALVAVLILSIIRAYI